MRSMRKGGRSESAPGRGGLRRRGGMEMCYHEEGLEEVIGNDGVGDADGETPGTRRQSSGVSRQMLWFATSTAFVVLRKVEMELR